jgi:hypothetical protein
MFFLNQNLLLPQYERAKAHDLHQIRNKNIKQNTLYEIFPRIQTLISQKLAFCFLPMTTFPLRTLAGII